MTPEQIKHSLAEYGMTVKEYARLNGFSESLVYAVLAGKNKASRGESHRIAVALGLKPPPPTVEVPAFLASALARRERRVVDPSSPMEVNMT